MQFTPSLYTFGCKSNQDLPLMWLPPGWSKPPKLVWFRQEAAATNCCENFFFFCQNFSGILHDTIWTREWMALLFYSVCACGPLKLLRQGKHSHRLHSRHVWSVYSPDGGMLGVFQNATRCVRESSLVNPNSLFLKRKKMVWRLTGLKFLSCMNTGHPTTGNQSI